ncbi:hypothetical protein HYE11_00705 [Mycoplasmopsis bovis]|nr:hypothetical protein HYE11_00705 [Mycoplasmopsis bovis]
MDLIDTSKIHKQYDSITKVKTDIKTKQSTNNTKDARTITTKLRIYWKRLT